MKHPMITNTLRRTAGFFRKKIITAKWTTAWMVAGLSCGAFAAGPATLQDPMFALIQLPAEFQAQRQSTDTRLVKGQEVEIFRASGTGCVRHIWFCTNIPEGNLILKVYADGVAEPQVNMEMQRFFGVLLDQKPYRVDSAAFQDLPMTEGPVQGPGYNCYLPIPFRNGCRITVEAMNDHGIAVQVDWQKYQLDTGLTPYRLHAVHRREFPAGHRASFPMADISGRGFVAGIFKGIRQRDFSDMIYHTKGQLWLIDGETAPHAINGHNEEDDFSFFWGYQRVMTPWIGCPYHRHSGRENQDGVIYRFFGPDPIPFRSSLVLSCGSRADDTETVVYYYLAEGSKAVPVRSPASWQLTGPFECRNYEQFLASEFPERKPGNWEDPLRDGDRTMPVRTATAAHTWIDLWPFYRAGGAPEALVDNSVYARTTINSDLEKPVQFKFGFDDWLAVWLNGEKLGSIRHDHGLEMATIAGQLRKGSNELLVKTSNFQNINRRLWAINCVVGE
ncbi:MAG: DUF2961 domain-containing protein [Verrucomicrobia bacterium]|nr:DUF2961 domain-containing protein [Verrucomicrobiota bacterium]